MDELADNYEKTRPKKNEDNNAIDIVKG